MLKRDRDNLEIVLGILAALAVVGAVYLSFFYSPSCKNYECWQGYMTKCERATFVNEEPEASWGYTIKGLSGKECVINVKLLQAKQGELGIEKLVGEDMTCSYPKGVSAYVEKDLSKCHGLLRESLLVIVINKLHAYLLENLGQFNESVNQVT